MDLLRITPAELESAIAFSEIMKMEDLHEAASILASYDWDIERAIGSIDLNSLPAQQQQSKIGKEDKGEKEQKVKKVDLHKKPPELSKIDLKKDKIESKSTISEQSMYQSQKIHNFSQVQRQEEAMQVGQKNKNLATNQVFISYITNKYHPLINFAFDSLGGALRTSFKQQKYVLVYVHHIDEAIEKRYDGEVRQIMSNKDIARFVNNYCIAYGVIHESPEYAVIAEYLSKEKNTPLFAVFKYDYIHRKEDFLSYYNPKAQDLNFLEWLSMTIDINVEGGILHRVGERFLHSRSNQEIKEQSKVKQQQQGDESFIGYSYLSDYKDEEKGIPSHLRESAWKKSIISDKESKVRPSLIRKRQEDNNLMWEQDAAYKKMENSYLRKKEVSELKHEESKIKASEQEAKQKALKDRQKEMENLFSDVVGLPNGVSVIQKFSLTDDASKLFTYVDLFCRGHFQEKFSDFGLALIYSDLKLEDRKAEKLDKVFEGEKAVTLIVKEL